MRERNADEGEMQMLMPLQDRETVPCYRKLSGAGGRHLKCHYRAVCLSVFLKIKSKIKAGILLSLLHVGSARKS